MNEELDLTHWIGKHYTEVEIRYNPLAPSHRFLLIRSNYIPTLRSENRVDVYIDDFGYIKQIDM